MSDRIEKILTFLHLANSHLGKKLLCNFGLAKSYCQIVELANSYLANSHLGEK